MKASEQVLASVCFDWLRSMVVDESSIAITLNFLPRRKVRVERGVSVIGLTELIAQEAVRHYLRRLDAEAFGKGALRRKQTLHVVAVREGGFESGQKHFHYHLQVQIPPGWSAEEWKRAAADCWQQIDWASPRNNEFRDVFDSGWLLYQLKTRDKADYLSAIDFENMRLQQ